MVLRALQQLLTQCCYQGEIINNLFLCRVLWAVVSYDLRCYVLHSTPPAANGLSEAVVLQQDGLVKVLLAVHGKATELNAQCNTGQHTHAALAGSIFIL